MYSSIYKNFSMIALFDIKTKEPFIQEARQRGYIPCCYTINKEILDLMDRNSPNTDKVIGVMIMIEYKRNEFKC